MGKRTKTLSARKIRLLKIEEPEPGKQRVELEIEGAPLQVPAPIEPDKPVELDLTVPEVAENSWLKWLRSLW